ncbi:hypothetical protein L0F63_001349, partial [Massospora cicadina]
NLVSNVHANPSAIAPRQALRGPNVVAITKAAATAMEVANAPCPMPKEAKAVAAKD